VRLPEDVCTVGADQSVVFVLLGGAFEGLALRVHDEKDYACREKIDLGAHVGTIRENFWRHVVLSTQLGLQVA
jgi:hypothetical protein